MSTDRYPLAELASLPPDIRDKLMAVQEKAGFVPNVFLKLARRPEEFRAVTVPSCGFTKKIRSLQISSQ